MAYSPRTNYFYVTAADRPAARIAPGSGRVAPPAFGAKYGGTLTAVDARTNKIAWQKRMPYSIGQGSGALVTAAGVLFHGEPDGHFQAYDARNGELLWQWQTGAGADAPAITYEIDGVQYVAIAVGGLATQTASTNGDTVWAFSLRGSPNNRIAQFEAPLPPPTEVSFGFTGLLKGGVPIEKTNAVRMIDYNFTPSRITIEAGSKVTFTNGGNQPHNAAGADAGGWDTGILKGSETATVTFNRPGTYNYTCTPHPFMIGQIIVTGETVSSASATVVESPMPRAIGAPADHDAHLPADLHREDRTR
jgi:alcohol dehydrogenase (cytochrome c)